MVQLANSTKDFGILGAQAWLPLRIFPRTLPSSFPSYIVKSSVKNTYSYELMIAYLSQLFQKTNQCADVKMTYEIRTFESTRYERQTRAPALTCES